MALFFFHISDSANYILWNAQIMATQGSMARCMVAEVLKLYKSCMKNMYKRNRIDEITLSNLHLNFSFKFQYLILLRNFYFLFQNYLVVVVRFYDNRA